MQADIVSNICGFMDGWMEGWRDGRMDTWMNGWMDGYAIYRAKKVLGLCFALETDRNGVANQRAFCHAGKSGVALTALLF